MNRVPALLLVALAGCLAAGCGRHSSDASASPTPDDPVADSGAHLLEIPSSQAERLTVVPVESSLVRPALSLPALVTFDELKTSDVTPLVSGKVQRILVHEGDHVTAGQSLAEIASPDSSDTSANLKRDLATLQTKQQIAARDEDLYQHKAISLEEYQLAKLDVASAQAAVDDDQAHARITGAGTGKALLTAPISGTVVSRKVSEGTAVQSGSTVCFTITDPAIVWVVGQLYQQDLRRVAVGDDATVASPALPAPIAGKVDYIGASVDPNSLTVPVRIPLDNPGGLLKAGAYVDLSIVPQTARKAIVVPAAAILRDSDNLPFVYVEVADRRFSRRHVELGESLGDRQIVSKGLADGEKVLADGALYMQFAESLGQ